MSNIFEKPSFQRPEPTVIGKATPEKKEKYKKEILDNFGEKHYDQLSENQKKF